MHRSGCDSSGNQSAVGDWHHETADLLPQEGLPTNLPPMHCEMRKAMKSASPDRPSISKSTTRLAVGEKNALVALQNCLPPSQYCSRWVRIVSGDVMSLPGYTQTEVVYCKKK
jgi:hypothetical protein